MHACMCVVCVWVIVCVCALASGHASPTPSKPKACWTAGNNCGHVAPFARKTVPYLIACLLTYLLTYLYTYLLACLLTSCNFQISHLLGEIVSLLCVRSDHVAC